MELAKCQRMGVETRYTHTKKEQTQEEVCKVKRKAEEVKNSLPVETKT